MKRQFGFSLQGKDWWAIYLLFWVLFLVIYIPELRLKNWGPSASGQAGLYLLVVLLFVVAILILSAIFTIVFLRIILAKVTFDGAPFSFGGSIGRFLGMMLLGTLLSIVTVTIYVPWFARRIYAYVASETSFRDERLQFLGKGGKFFVYYLLAALIPIIVVTVVFVFVVGVQVAGGNAPRSGLYTGVLSGIFFIVLIPFIYLTYKWMVNIQWKNLTVRWQTSFWPSCFFILGQLLLTVITAIIYWPAASLRIYRYFVGKTALQGPDGEVARLGFEGSIGRGFGLLWGQFLLTVITLGIYAPWAYTNVARWLLGATYVETKNPV